MRVNSHAGARDNKSHSNPGRGTLITRGWRIRNTAGLAEQPRHGGLSPVIQASFIVGKIEARTRFTNSASNLGNRLKHDKYVQTIGNYALFQRARTRTRADLISTKILFSRRWNIARNESCLDKSFSLLRRSSPNLLDQSFPDFNERTSRGAGKIRRKK
jgi:hypothetical protein